MFLCVLCKCFCIKCRDVIEFEFEHCGHMENQSSFCVFSAFLRVCLFQFGHGNSALLDHKHGVNFAVIYQFDLKLVLCKL